VMMRLTQALGYDVPAINLEEIREKVIDLAPDLEVLKDIWAGAKQDKPVPSAHHKGAILPNVATMKAVKALDVVSRYSMYREGAWVRASALLVEAGNIHALDDVIVHPETLNELGLEAGELTVLTNQGDAQYQVGLRDDVSPGVLFISKRGAAGDVSTETSVDLRGGAS